MARNARPGQPAKTFSQIDSDAKERMIMQDGVPARAVNWFLVNLSKTVYQHRIGLDPEPFACTRWTTPDKGGESIEEVEEYINILMRHDKVLYDGGKMLVRSAAKRTLMGATPSNAKGFANGIVGQVLPPSMLLMIFTEISRFDLRSQPQYTHPVSTQTQPDRMHTIQWVIEWIVMQLNGQSGEPVWPLAPPEPGQEPTLNGSPIRQALCGDPGNDALAETWRIISQTYRFADACGVLRSHDWLPLHPSVQGIVRDWADSHVKALPQRKTAG